MKIILASSERFSGCLVDALTQAGHEVCGVVSPAAGIYNHSFQGMRFWRFAFRGWDIQEICRKKDIDLYVTRNLQEGALTAFFKRTQADLLLVFGWPNLIKQPTLDLFTYGGMNIHPAQLPKLRGPDPLFVIVDEKLDAFGITYHKLVDELDAGPIYLRVPLQYHARDPYDRLYRRILDGLYRHTAEAVANLETNPAGQPQEGVPSFVPRFKQSMRILDPDADFDQSLRRTLACHPHHSRLTSLGGNLIHFRKVKARPRFRAEDVDNAQILKSDPFGITVRIGNQVARLSGIRINEEPAWLTPFKLQALCRRGLKLGSASETQRLLKSAVKSTQKAS